jgi:hypothetical protein
MYPIVDICVCKDFYLADRLMHDIALALMATQTQTTEVLDTFPTIPAVQEAEQILGSAENPEVTIPQEALPCRNTSMPPITN